MITLTYLEKNVNEKNPSHHQDICPKAFVKLLGLQSGLFKKFVESLHFKVYGSF
jgi:hypothetical protein